MTRIGFAALIGLAALAFASVPSRAEVAQFENVRIGVDARLTPKRLPRQGHAPATIRLAVRVRSVDGSLPSRLRAIEVELNRHWRLDRAALPVCQLRQIQSATTSGALAACGDSQVGEGSFSAKVLLPEQVAFPSHGRVVVFNGRFRGRPALLAHVYGTDPFPTSVTLPFVIRARNGVFGTVLTASLPRVTSASGYVTGLAMTLGRGAGSASRPYVSARCPARPGLGSVVFPLARAGFQFAGAPTLRSTLMRGCAVRPGRRGR